MSLKIKESELKDILAEVTEDLAKAFKSTEDKLAKAEPIQKDAPPPSEDESGDDAGSPPAEGSESAPPPAADASADAPPASPDASASPDATPSPEGVDPAAEQAAALTPEALQAEYTKLSPEELDMHIKAALAAKAAVAGAPAPDAGGLPPPDASAAPAPDASAAPMAPPAAPPGPPAMKAELKASPERNGKDSIDSIAKSEFEAVNKAQTDEITALKALVKSQAEDIENLAKVTKAVLEQPLRKAVTSVAHLPKVEEKKDLSSLTKADITAHLSKKASQPNLAKSDRQLINDFFDGKVRADKLAPLFEDYK